MTIDVFQTQVYLLFILEASSQTFRIMNKSSGTVTTAATPSSAASCMMVTIEQYTVCSNRKVYIVSLRCILMFVPVDVGQTSHIVMVDLQLIGYSNSCINPFTYCFKIVQITVVINRKMDILTMHIFFPRCTCCFARWLVARLSALCWQSSKLIGYSNSCTNPFIYCFKLK